jgi:UDP-glucose 4-epimerase
MKVLVTGGRGYVGGRLCEFLAGQGSVEVICASRNVHSSDQERVRMVVADWESETSLQKICAGVDVIVHLAAMNAADCIANPVGALAMNGVATVRLLQAARSAGVRRFIYLSTAHVYSGSLTGTITEDTWPFPVHPYATSHRAAEDAVLAAEQQGWIEGIVLRMSNAFGKPVHQDVNCWDLLFNDLCRQVVTQGEIVLRSSGLQRRDFIPMTDVSRAIFHTIMMPNAGFVLRLFNLGGNWSPTISEVADLVANRFELRFGKHIPIQRKTAGKGERTLPLDYRSDALYHTGFGLETDRISELDALLSFCEQIFKVKHG